MGIGSEEVEDVQGEIGVVDQRARVGDAAQGGALQGGDGDGLGHEREAACAVWMGGRLRVAPQLALLTETQPSEGGQLVTYQSLSGWSSLMSLSLSSRVI